MPMKRGQDGKVTINGVVFAYQRVRASDRNSPQQVSNSEGRPGNSGFGFNLPGFVSKISDLSEGQIEIVAATYDDSANAFGTPPALSSGLWYTVLFYPSGLGGDAWQMSNALLVEITHEAVIPGLQPLTLRFETDGLYLLPGQT